MEKNRNDVVSITNITNYDFPYIDLRALNAVFKDKRKKVSSDTASGPFEYMGLEFQKPEVPTLMWDGETYPLAAGETKQYPRWLAVHFMEKIVDRALVEKKQVSLLRDEKVRDKLRNQIFTDPKSERIVAPVTKPKYELTEEETEEVEEKPVTASINDIATDDMAMPQLRKIAKNKGLTIASTTKKSELINLINAG